MKQLSFLTSLELPIERKQRLTSAFISCKSYTAKLSPALLRRFSRDRGHGVWKTPRSHLCRGYTAAPRCWSRDDSAETPSLRNFRQRPIPQMHTLAPTHPSFLQLSPPLSIEITAAVAPAAGPALFGCPGNGAQLYCKPPLAIGAVFAIQDNNVEVNEWLRNIYCFL